MKTTDQIRLSAISIINDVITLKANVANGCYSDQSELNNKMSRLQGIKTWAIQNDQLKTIQHYFAAHNFGSNNQFASSEISTFFYN